MVAAKLFVGFQAHNQQSFKFTGLRALPGLRLRLIHLDPFGKKSKEVRKTYEIAVQVTSFHLDLCCLPQHRAVAHHAVKTLFEPARLAIGQSPAKRSVGQRDPMNQIGGGFDNIGLLIITLEIDLKGAIA